MPYSFWDHQSDAIDSAENYFRETKKGNGVIEIPTGGGKSPVIAGVIELFVNKYNARILTTAHRKEIVGQNQEASFFHSPSLRGRIGTYSAGLRSRDTDHQVIFGGIQSIYDKMDDLGRFNLWIPDECQFLPLTGNGQFKTVYHHLKEQNPKLRVLGLTATPYRLDSGPICGWTEDHILNEIIYKAHLKDLIDQGYLVRPITKPTTMADVSRVPVGANSDYIQYKLEEAVIAPDLIKKQIDELIAYGQDRRCWAIYCVGIAHAKAVTNEIASRGVAVTLIHSDMRDRQRDQNIEDFKNGIYQCLVNIDIASIGFDHDKIDLIGMMRRTLSVGLYYQQPGRGFRVEKIRCSLCGTKSVVMEKYCNDCGAPLERHKKDCLVLDWAGNIGLHGAIDKIEPEQVDTFTYEGEKKIFRKCKQCGGENHIKFKECQYCGTPFPRKKRKINVSPTAITNAPIISKPVRYPVNRTTYRSINGQLIVHYWCGDAKYSETFEFTPEKRVEDWSKMKARLPIGVNLDAPISPEHFLKAGYKYKLKEPAFITVDDLGSRFKIISMEF